MKAIYCLGLPTLLLSTALPIYADDANSAADQQTSAASSNIATYLLNLGADLGYDLTQAPPSPPTPISPLLPSTSSQLFGPSGNTSSQQLPFFTTIFDTFLGAVPVNALFMQFVPTSNATYSLVNSLANATFPSYNSASSQQSTTISVNPAIDQQTYQQDPVSQAVLNILGTPNYTYCMNNDASSWTGGNSGTSTTTTATPYPKCDVLYQYQVMNNVIGTLPNTYQYYTSTYNQQFLSQLNGNTLIAPLLYSTTTSSSNTSSSPQTPPSGAGLTAQSQAQQAANFIRYATGSVTPPSLPKLQDYDALYTLATSTPNSTNPTQVNQQIQAQAILANYFAKLRVYAAQTSIAYSNLYDIFSKRMPQTNGGSDSSQATSQALNEFTMATWRLYTPGGRANTNWRNQINQASPATVQKEMVTLLAEINYQMYLKRQQQERLLLTNTMLLLLSSRSSQPSAPTPQNASAP